MVESFSLNGTNDIPGSCGAVVVSRLGIGIISVMMMMVPVRPSRMLSVHRQSRRLPPPPGGGSCLVHVVLDGVQPLGQRVQAVCDPQQLVALQRLLLLREQHQAEHVADREIDAAYVEN